MIAVKTLIVAVFSICFTGFVVGDETKASPPIPNHQPKQSADLQSKLNEQITFEFQGGSLKDALDYLQQTYHIIILVDTMAFRVEVNIPDIYNAPVKFEKMEGLRLRTVLRLLTDQVEGDFYRQDETLIVAPKMQMTFEFLLRRPVNLSFNEVSLDEALQKVANSLGLTIVVDKRLKEKLSIPVTAKFNQVPVETAVRVLADMNDLKAVSLDNMLYVTNKENAERIMAEHGAEQDNRRRMRQRAEEGDPIQGTTQQPSPPQPLKQGSNPKTRAIDDSKGMK